MYWIKRNSKNDSILIPSTTWRPKNAKSAKTTNFQEYHIALHVAVAYINSITIVCGLKIVSVSTITRISSYL
jgi:hypothetical protein